MKGEELKVIEEWRENYDEIDELKKVFFQFLKRWVEIDSGQQNVNKLKLYQRQKDATKFSLQPNVQRCTRSDRLSEQSEEEDKSEEWQDHDNLIPIKDLIPSLPTEIETEHSPERRSVSRHSSNSEIYRVGQRVRIEEKSNKVNRRTDIRDNPTRRNLSKVFDEKQYRSM